MISRKLLVWTLVLVVLAVLAALGWPYTSAIRVAANAVADAVCAKTFVSQLDPQGVFAETMERPGIRRLRRYMTYEVDRADKTIVISVAGLVHSHAAFHEGLGCVLLNGSEPPYLPKIDIKADIAALRTPKTPQLPPDVAGQDIVEPSDPALKAALDHAFEEPGVPPFRRTKAVVVLRDGKVIAERYAEGIGIDTELIGFSMTKSVVNALLGIMTAQGLISPSQPAPVPEWQAASDPRRVIKIEHLMRMTTGLALDETSTGLDPSSQMYLFRDMAGFAVKAEPVAPPGQRWAYSSATTQILSRIIRDTLGGPEQVLTFAWRELFDPLGMRHVTIEFDASGTMQGAANMLASARDWARFGLLYLDDGRIGGKRLLPAGWVDFSVRATLDTDYGAGFWTNRSADEHAKGRVRQGIPGDAFYASGNLGQRIVILPTQHMVVVRLGDAVAPDGDIQGLERLVREVIAATAP